MWTKEELIKIRERAEEEASVNGQNALWQYACLNLAQSAGNLLEITRRIEEHELTAVTEYYRGFKAVR